MQPQKPIDTIFEGIKSLKNLAILLKDLSKEIYLRPDVAIFSKLVELELFSMDGRELCHGSYPGDFFKQQKELQLSKYEKLESTLFDGKMELYNLKRIDLCGCSMTSLFHPSTAQSLKQLEALQIRSCFELKYIVAETMDDHNPNHKNHDSMFPKLKDLLLTVCPELEFVMPIRFCKDLPLLERMHIYYCRKLKYIFGQQYPKETDLNLDQKGKGNILQLLEEVCIWGAPNFINIYAEYEVQKSSPITKVEVGTSSLSKNLLHCFWPKSNASTKHHLSASMTTQLNHKQALKVNYVVNRAHGLFTPPLYPFTSLRRMEIFGLCGLKSLFTQSIVSSSKLLELLQVKNCNTLKHIVTNEERGHDHVNVNHIFPNLRELYASYCSHLEYILPAFYSKNNMSFQNLSMVTIQGCKRLKFIFCASSLRWLQKLKRLEVLDCEELASIIEDEEDQKNPMPPPQVCFPELCGIIVKHCESLKCLFSKSSGKLPRLLYVNIEDVPQLGQVFGWKQEEGQKPVMGDVLPKLVAIRLVKMLTLRAICQETDFQNVKIRHVRECPNISSTLANDSYDALRGFSRPFQIHSQDEEEYYAEISNWAFEISSPKKPQIETSAPHKEVEAGSSQSDPSLAFAITDPSAKGGFELEVSQPCISKIAAFEDDKVAKAFDDLESSLKMDLNQIANSKEHTHRLENALNFLSTYFCKDGTSSHSLIIGKIDSLREEILKFISSFKQANDKLDRFTKLPKKEKWVDEEYAQKMEAGNTLVSEIRNTENCMIELEEQVSRLQAELKSNKEKELEDCKIKLSSLQKQKKECVLDIIRFMEEYEVVKRDKSHVVDGQIKASQELKELENQWPSCLADSRKTALLLEILLQQ
ncbi:uncharacterized protein LOC114742488 [Neltuma alba]|uniref:uncharacterized protein LOC114742488 n=1 Tax=Neltuma alba TaxID=207710 RepID=UPI0010A59181|nr:uncharacterized protein LOC114742488 [Prosopis alba]